MTMTMMVMMMVRDGDEKEDDKDVDGDDDNIFRRIWTNFVCEVMARAPSPMTHQPTPPPPLPQSLSPVRLVSVESLRSDNSDGKENGNKAIGLY